MLEDSEEGVMELVTHCVGVSEDLPEYESLLVTRKRWFVDHKEWQVELQLFLQPIYEFLGRLDWKLNVDCHTVNLIREMFAECPYFAPRKEYQLFVLQSRMAQGTIYL